ncbi:MAG: hypothetical protein H3C38_10440 [Rhodospirillales bacterium]|nr:hypothetical protein [Rhodospirillales bacterium]
MSASPQRPSAQETETQESLLLATAQRVGRVREGRIAVHLHLSRLRPYNRQDGHLRIVLRMLDPLIHYRGQIFLLSNSDIVFICADAQREDIETIIYRVRALYSKDPLTFADSGDGRDRFSTFYDLEVQYHGFLALAARLNDEAQKRQKEARKSPPLDALTPERLGDIVDRLEEVDIARLVRRQAAVSLGEKNAAGAIFQEYFFSMADLQRAIAPGVNVLANRWLFQHLSQALDQYMLRSLQRSDLRVLPPAISVNLNVATLTSPGFKAFEKWIEGRCGLVVEAQVVDIFADLGSYFFTRDRLRAAGHRVLLDGLTPLTMQFLDITMYDADLFKLNWSPDLADPSQTRELKPLLDELGIDRFVLGRCDSETAIQWGLYQGISSFQGRFVDAMSSAVAMGQCPKAAACTLAQCTARHSVIAGPQRGECQNLPLLDSFPKFKMPRRGQGKAGNG